MDQRYSRYSAKNMELALVEIREGCMTCNAAAKAFGDPRSTLRDKLSGRSPEDRQMGPNPVLTKAERVLWQASA